MIPSFVENLTDKAKNVAFEFVTSVLDVVIDYWKAVLILIGIIFALSLGIFIKRTSR